jgi:hypothetical protein
VTAGSRAAGALETCLRRLSLAALARTHGAREHRGRFVRQALLPGVDQHRRAGDGPVDPVLRRQEGEERRVRAPLQRIAVPAPPCVHRRARGALARDEVAPSPRQPGEVRPGRAAVLGHLRDVRQLQPRQRVAPRALDVAQQPVGER